jgi:hypothetical protein
VKHGEADAEELAYQGAGGGVAPPTGKTEMCAQGTYDDKANVFHLFLRA